MTATMRKRLILGLLSAMPMICGSASLASEITVRAAPVDDLKSVIATVEPVHVQTLRARIGGTISALKVKEGDRVAAGEEVALVTDQKLYLQIQGIDQRIQSLQAQRDKARADLDRAQDLLQHGVTTKVLRDQARTAFDVAEKSLAAMRSDRGVVEQQASEGKVLAAGAGRVLTVPVSVGRAVMPGETIATVTEDKYILRLQLPERHARFIRAGDTVQIGGRGVEESGQDARTSGRVLLVYPQIQGGRVVADVEVNGLGDYFVGERTRIYVPTGKRKAIFVPRAAVYRRAGVDFVRLKDGAEIVVQTGEARGKEIEVLSGLRDGDVVTAP
ncbi:membrane protein [Methylocystis bryophila]|nr:membrane protein [Methylocystis bryophila]